MNADRGRPGEEVLLCLEHADAFEKWVVNAAPNGKPTFLFVVKKLNESQFRTALSGSRSNRVAAKDDAVKSTLLNFVAECAPGGASRRLARSFVRSFVCSFVRSSALGL